MGWHDPPYHGDVWRKRVEGKTETRHVMDRTLGGDVYFVRGRYFRHAYQCKCSQAEWDAWQVGAKQLEKGEAP